MAMDAGEMRYPEFAAWLAREMARRGFETRKAFAEWVGVEPATMSRWMRGRTPAGGESIEALARLTGTPEAEIRRLCGWPEGAATSTIVPSSPRGGAARLREAILLAQQAEADLRALEQGGVVLPVAAVRDAAMAVAAARGETTPDPGELPVTVRSALVEGHDAMAVRAVGDGLLPDVEHGEIAVLARESDWGRVAPGQVVWAARGAELVVGELTDDGRALTRAGRPDEPIDGLTLIGRRLARVIED